MSGGYCPTITIKVEVQSNGILRLADTGRFLGRLTEDEEINYEKLSKYDLGKGVLGPLLNANKIGKLIVVEETSEYQTGYSKGYIEGHNQATELFEKLVGVVALSKPRSTEEILRDMRKEGTE
jgi:hypothetical protein